MKKHVKLWNRITSLTFAGVILGMTTMTVQPPMQVNAAEDVITLRVCNWEEYIDEGGWDEEELIDLDNGMNIIGENSMVEDFEDWYYETYGKKVKVEYSCFGTNEELYSQLTLGDTYDLVCPSDYLIMKLMTEGWLEPFSDEFMDETGEYNYYAKGVSPYIRQVFDENEIDGVPWSEYASCYMWGTTGVLYNPEYMTKEEASSWAVFDNPKFKRQLTLKDNVRDTYFAVLGYLKSQELCDESFLNREDYQQQLAEIMNDVSPETISEVGRLLQKMMGNIYALETDSGKADMITGKIVANYQWSGDAVYAMDQAEEDDVYLAYAYPKECSNLWFDGWVMLKKGINEDAEKKHAAEAFVNFLARPDNAVRNMYYIGYTSSIAGGEDDTVYSYLNWCYEADDEAEEVVEYPLGYFFSGDDADPDYIVSADAEMVDRQLGAQYPSKDVIERTAIMGFFDETETKNINQMWIDARCFNIKDVPVYAWVIVIFMIAVVVILIAVHKKNQMWKEK